MIASLYQSGSAATSAAVFARVSVLVRLSRVRVSILASILASMSGTAARRELPDGERQLARIEADALQLAVPHEIEIAHEVAHRDRGVIGHAPFPQRHLDCRLVGAERIEIDGDQDHVAAVRSHLAV